MSDISGIKSVDFSAEAKGHGVVNWNGPTSLSNEGKTVDNHTLPKLRGYTNLTGKVKEGSGYKYKKEATDIDFKETPLYISQNCIRHHMFKEQAYDLHYANKQNVLNVLASLTGLIRGYVIPSSQYRRTSALLIEDFVDDLGNGNFEQFGQSGERDSSSFFSKTTFGDTHYTSYGSISIEQIQFISLDNKFDRPSMTIEVSEGDDVAQRVADFIQSLDTSRKPKVVFNENYVRKGTIFNIGEAGLLLDDIAIDILIQKTLEIINRLVIKQAKGYMYVSNVEVDYNDSDTMMRIKRMPDEIVKKKNGNKYAVYFEARDRL